MDDYAYFRVGYRENKKAKGIVVRTDEKDKLEIFSGATDEKAKEFNIIFNQGVLRYNSNKYFVQRITKIEAEKHRDGYEEWKGLQAFTSGASPAGIYSATSRNLNSKLGAF